MVNEYYNLIFFLLKKKLYSYISIGGKENKITRNIGGCYIVVEDNLDISHVVSFKILPNKKLN